MRDVFVGLGSNLGDRRVQLLEALRMLEEDPQTRVEAVSHAYESEPWGVADQPPFLNAVARIEFDGEADDLLVRLKDIERSLGRGSGERWGPREIDLDILLFGDEEWVTEELTIPHPHLLERDFVIVPLLELAPGIVLPDGTPVTRRAAPGGAVTADLGPLEAGAPGGWVQVGPEHFETGSGATDFALLHYEAELTAAGIPCRFEPHRPNECPGPYRYTLPDRTVRLLVPKDRQAEAERIVEDLSAPG